MEAIAARWDELIRFLCLDLTKDLGRDVKQVLAKQERAARLGLSAALRIDPVTSDVVLDLEGDARPDRLDFELIFPTQDDRDIELTLEHVRDGRYVGQAPDNLRYRWYLQLQPAGEDPEWRLIGEARFPDENVITLTPGRPAAE